MPSKNSQGVAQITGNILSYLKDIADFAISPDFNEGAFQAYLGIGRSIVTPDGDHIALRLANELRTKLRIFDASWQLRTGFSMEIIWELFRPPLAQNIAQLKHFLEIEQLADRFDTLKWKVGASVKELFSFGFSLILFSIKVYSQSAYGDNSFEVSNNLVIFDLNHSQYLGY